LICTIHITDVAAPGRGGQSPRDDLVAAVIEGFCARALAEADELSRALPSAEAVAESLVRVSWGLRSWHDLPVCLATAHDDDSSALNSANAPLVERVGVLLDAAEKARRRVAMATAGVFRRPGAAEVSWPGAAAGGRGAPRPAAPRR
jgi:hypothetical protein